MQKLAELCIRRPVFATMLIVSLVVLGTASYLRLGVDLYPSIDFPTVTVTTVLAGASPEEIETTITQKIEEAVNTIEGIDELRSVSAEGISQVFVTFVLEKPASEAAQEIRDKVNRILSQLPEDADVPFVEKLETDASPVLSIVFSSSQVLREMTERVDDIVKKNIESLRGVGQIRMIGGRRRQIQILLRTDRLTGYNISVEDIRRALVSQNVEIPGGRVDQGNRELTLRTMGRVEEPRDFGELIVAQRNGAVIRIADLGRVVDTVEEPRTLARLNGRNALVLEVRKQSGTNAVEVIRAVKERVSELRSELPADYEVTYVLDQSDFIEASFEAVQEHLVLGGLLAAFIVFLFVRNIRLTLIAAIAIPTSIIATFSLVDYMGFSLNQITMLALTLVVGVVIDDAIVVLENIYRFLEEKSMSPVEASIEGTREVGMAVMTTTLSLVIVFLPVAYMSGIVGKFMSSFGFTAAFAILVSLLVSFTLTPMLCSRFLKRQKPDPSRKSTRERGIFSGISRAYIWMLRWSLDHRIAISLLALALTASSAPLFVRLGVDFLPEDDQSAFEVTVQTPAGSSPMGTLSVLSEMEQIVADLPHVDNYLTTIGGDARQSPDRGSILVKLTPLDQRDASQQELIGLARERLIEAFPTLDFGVRPPQPISGSSSVNADLQFFVQGPDLEALNEVTIRLRERLETMPGVVDIDSTYESGKPEMRVTVHRKKASDLGVSVSSVATALRVLVGGDEQVTTYREGDDRFDVLLRAEAVDRDNLAALARMPLPSSTLGTVPLQSVVSVERGTGPVQINRYNRQRQISLTANIVDGQSLSNVIAALNSEVASLNLPATIRSGLLGRSRELQRATFAYAVALVLALSFMYIVLAALFESFVHPLTVMSTLPLAVPFALLSLYLTGESFSIIYSSLGILILFGVVKKNAILQVDHIDQLRFQEGMERREAILRGCADRLRPILMTTLSLVAGMAPLALGTGAGSGSRRSVAVIIIGGQMLCLLITLLVAPVVYTMLEDFVDFRNWRLSRGISRGVSKWRGRASHSAP